MQTMSASQFKARCLRVMDDVHRTRLPVLLTKKGRPVAKLIPADERRTGVFGCMADTTRIVGDLVSPVVAASAWKASR